MKILFTGKGGAGSWEIRGRQLAQALGAKAIPNASADECAKYDVVVVVKKQGKADISKARLVVWDIVDAWPQPAGNQWTPKQGREYLRGRVACDAVVYATKQMASDLNFPMPSLVLPHHHRPGIKRNPIRGTISRIGYEGDPRFLEEWRDILEHECQCLGWEFVINPKSVDSVDALVAFRAGRFGGSLPRRWKSNVKLANAQGSGTPIICNRESGYQETSDNGVFWCDSLSELRGALRWLTDYQLRCEIHEHFLSQSFSVDQAAEVYGAWLSSLRY